MDVSKHSEDNLDGASDFLEEPLGSQKTGMTNEDADTKNLLMISARVSPVQGKIPISDVERTNGKSGQKKREQVDRRRLQESEE